MSKPKSSEPRDAMADLVDARESAQSVSERARAALERSTAAVRYAEASYASQPSDANAANLDAAYAAERRAKVLDADAAAKLAAAVAAVEAEAAARRQHEYDERHAALARGCDEYLTAANPDLMALILAGIAAHRALGALMRRTAELEKLSEEIKAAGHHAARTRPVPRPRDAWDAGRLAGPALASALQQAGVPYQQDQAAVAPGHPTSGLGTDEQARVRELARAVLESEASHRPSGSGASPS